MSNKTGARFREIYKPRCWYYDGMYRATSNGNVVNIQRHSHESFTFKTIRTVSQEVWDEFFWENKLFYPDIKDHVWYIAKFAVADRVNEDDEHQGYRYE